MRSAFKYRNYIYPFLDLLRRKMDFVGGVFVVLLCGLALAILVAILEFCWNSKKNAQTDRVSISACLHLLLNTFENY